MKYEERQFYFWDVGLEDKRLKEIGNVSWIRRLSTFYLVKDYMNWLRSELLYIRCPIYFFIFLPKTRRTGKVLRIDSTFLGLNWDLSFDNLIEYLEYFHLGLNSIFNVEPRNWITDEYYCLKRQNKIRTWLDAVSAVKAITIYYTDCEWSWRPISFIYIRHERHCLPDVRNRNGMCHFI